MRIAIFGAGGAGGYFGGKLAQAGEEVTFIARGDHLKAIQASGLRVDSILGDFRVSPANATDDPAQVGPVEIVLLAVKAWQVPEAIRDMPPLIYKSTGVIFLGNGVDAPAQLTAALGNDPVMGGLCRISAFIAAPGHIRHAGIQPYVAFGELDGHHSERAALLLQAFQRAGVNAEIPADILAAIWEKFIFIAAFSGVGAVARAPVGPLRNLPGTRRLLQSAIAEIESLARSHDIRLPADIAAKTIAFIDAMGPGVTASMQRDIIDGRPSELESQNGAVVRIGREQGLPTPVNQFIYDSLLPQELKARGEIEFSLG
jgi:2-dehydropantoate 2-reductase